MHQCHPILPPLVGLIHPSPGHIATLPHTVTPPPAQCCPYLLRFICLLDLAPVGQLRSPASGSGFPASATNPLHCHNVLHGPFATACTGRAQAPLVQRGAAIGSLISAFQSHPPGTSSGPRQQDQDHAFRVPLESGFSAISLFFVSLLDSHHMFKMTVLWK